MLPIFIILHLIFVLSAQNYDENGKLHCSNETINPMDWFNNMWELTSGFYAPMQNCIYTIGEIPTNQYYKVEAEIQLSSPSKVKFEAPGNFSQEYNANFSLSLMVFPPPYFKVSLSFGNSTTFVSLRVRLRKTFSFGSASTQVFDVSRQSVELFGYTLDETTTYIFKSTNGVKLFLVSQKEVNDKTLQLTNIFVYNGSSAAAPFTGTMFQFLNSEVLVAESLSLYVTQLSTSREWASTIVVCDRLAAPNYKTTSMSMVPYKNGPSIPPPTSFTFQLDASNGTSAHTLYSYHKKSAIDYLSVIILNIQFLDGAESINVFDGNLLNTEGRKSVMSFYQNSTFPQYFSGKSRTFVLEKGKVVVKAQVQNEDYMPVLNITGGWRGTIQVPVSGSEDVGAKVNSSEVFLRTNETPLNYTFTWKQSDPKSILRIENFNDKNVSFFFPNETGKSLMAQGLQARLTGNAVVDVFTTGGTGNLRPSGIFFLFLSWLTFG